MSPLGPAPDRLRVATWNLNSLRARLPGVDRFLERARPDVLCLQETKAARVSTEATAVFDRHGYHVAHIGSGGYNGVAIASTLPLDEIVCSGGLGDEVLDGEPRIVSCLIAAPAPIRVVSVYAPHGRAIDHWHFQYKLVFFAALTARIREWMSSGTGLVVAGDLNVAANDSDVFHPDAFVDSVYVTPPARAALGGLFDAGLIDVDVARWGGRARRFTWWDLGRGYRSNLGMRLDMIATDRTLAERLDTTWIDHVGRSGERPSDHAALVADFRRSDPHP
ncbi:MAG: exodeoxyribonuclease III [Ilumatobacteraceae bacterium]